MDLSGSRLAERGAAQRVDEGWIVELYDEDGEVRGHLTLAAGSRPPRWEDLTLEARNARFTIDLLKNRGTDERGRLRYGFVGRADPDSVDPLTLRLKMRPAPDLTRTQEVFANLGVPLDEALEPDKR